MDAQARDWKRMADRLWADAFDYREAAQLAADMMRSDIAGLREAAAQALPGLRASTARIVDRHTREVARRRFDLMRNALHALDMPRFGRRGGPTRKAG